MPDSGSDGAWNLDVVAEVIGKEVSKSLNWVVVTRYFDQPNAVIPNEAVFQNLCKLVNKISGKPIAMEGLLGNWGNKRGQLAMLSLAASCPRQAVDCSSLLPSDRDSSIDSEVPTPANFSWLCPPLYTSLISLANSGLANEVLHVLTAAAQQFPEHVLLGLAMAKDPQSGVRADLLKRLLPFFTSGAGSRGSSILVMKRLADTNPELLVLLFRLGFKRATTVHEILEIDSRRRSFVGIDRRVEDEGAPDELLGFWCILADRSDFNLEAKLQKVMDAFVSESQKTSFSKYLMNFMKNYLPQIRYKEMAGGLLSVETFGIIVRLLRGTVSVSPDELGALTSEGSQYVQQLQQQQQQQQQQQLVRQQQVFGQPQGTGTGVNISRSVPVDGSAAGISNPGTAAFGQKQQQQIPPEIEEMANSYFQKIYTAEMSIPDVISMLKRFKTSTVKNELDIFRCMIHNLFDEYRFFHKYPEKELQVTGRLFGTLIQQHLVSNFTLGIALRYVLEALRKDPEQGGEKMFRFGKISLEQFSSRLNEWPQYCSHLVQINHLSRHCPELFKEAQMAVSAPPPPSSPHSSHPPAATAATSVPVASVPSSSPASTVGGSGASVGSEWSSVGDGELVAQMTQLSVDASSRTSDAISDQYTGKQPPEDASRTTDTTTEIDRMCAVNQETAITVVPPESARDQIYFIINNIAKNNIEAKCAELKAVLQPEHFNWFAYYLVVKRLSNQLNLHPLYITIIDTIDDERMTKALQNSVFHNVTKLLQSSKITTSSSERSILRHLGSWLGQVTLARNKPLLQRRVDLKELLFWGYENGRLIAVCTFVAKILEGAKDSRVFRPPNPWLMAILGVMKELFDLEDLKMNIKFEVQVLCNNIKVQLEDIPKGNLLADCQVPIKDRSPDFNPKPGSVGSTSPSPASHSIPKVSNEGSLPPALPPSAASVAPSSQEELSAHDKGEPAVVSGAGTLTAADLAAEQTVIPNLAPHVVINSSLAFFGKNPNYCRIVPLAIDRAIRDMIQSVVEHCATITCATMKMLILKDFAVEPNEMNLRTAAQLMITNLAGSLALVTCKEPLRISIGNHLRTLLTQVNADAASMEQIVQVKICSREYCS